MANNLKNLSDKDRKAIAYNTKICALVIAAYSLRGDVLDYVRKATSVSDAIARATKTKIYIDELMTRVEGSVKPPNATFSDADAAIEEASLEDQEQTCQPPLRWDPITQTCVPGFDVPV